MPKHLLVSLLAALALAGAAHAASAPAKPAVPSGRTETAIFAGGCFWSMEVDFEGVPGVRSVTSGYTGGTVANPSYDDVSTGRTGHLESIEVVFDPTRVTYTALLDRFWRAIDPTQADGQMYDIGSEYHTAVFTTTPEQWRIANESKAALERSRVLKKPIATAIRRAGPFYPAEEYHQDYYRKNPEHYHAYRAACGRDTRTFELWGSSQTLPLVH